MMPGSSAVEHPAVNGVVGGSIPPRAASFADAILIAALVQWMDRPHTPDIAGLGGLSGWECIIPYGGERTLVEVWLNDARRQSEVRHDE